MKFSIVTPTYNSERFLSETIQSVLSQKGDFSIEYIVVDNCSQDKTIDIVKSFQQLIANGSYPINCNGVVIQHYQKQDANMYEAINNGFAVATGDIYAWINSDDIYLPGAFAIIARSFERFPEINWLKGITSYIDETSTRYEEGKCYLYHQEWLKKGIYGREAYFVQQDSVFWNANLWRKVGGIDSSFKKAGDYSLWMNFARHAPLFSLKASISCFRKVKGQLSEDMESYWKECDLLSSNSCDNFLRKKIRLYFAYKDKFCPTIVQKLVYRTLFGKQNMPLIECGDNGQLALKTISYYVAD